MDMYLFETSDEELYKLDKLSRLYNLNPIGIDSPFIESLTSYIIRLAEAHGVTLGTLIGKELTSILNKQYLNNVAARGGGGLYKSASSLNGVKLAAVDLVAALERLTLRNNLRFLTLTCWSEVLTPRGLLRSQKAWCPVCFQEWYKNNNTIYEPLLWFFKEAVICPIHNVRLQAYCPTCLKEIPTLSRKIRIGYCSNCFHWLGQDNKDILTLDKETHLWDFWKAINISELLEKMPSITAFPVKNRIKLVLRSILELCNKNDGTHFFRLLETPKSSLQSWIGEDKIPSLFSLLKISYCLDISLTQLLTEELTNIKFNLRSFPFNKNTNHTLSIRFPEGYIEAQLKFWATSNVIPPPTLKKIASIIGCDRKLLYKKAPNLCEAISKKYLEYIKKRAQERIEFVKNRVIVAVNILDNKGIYPSRRKVEEFLEMPGVLKEQAIRRVWKLEIEKLKIEIIETS